MTTPVAFLKETFPTLFEKGVGILEQKAASGDAQSQRIVDDVKGVTGSACLVLGDAPPVYLNADGGKLSASDAPEQKVKVAAAVPADALGLLLGEATKPGALDNDLVAIGAAQTASKRLEDMLEDKEMTCHLTVNGVPDLGDATVRVGFNVTEPPEQPGFTAQIDYADLEAMQAGSTNMQELFMGGKLKMEGDYSTALQIAMQLLTNPL